VSTVVITGANRGLGLELVTAYAARGDTVIAGCRTPESAAELRAVTPIVHAVDVGDEQSIAAFARAIGDQPVDVLINNAGIDARAFGATDTERDVLVQPVAHLMGQIEVNAVGALLVSRALLPNLRQSPNARIVNVSSQIGSMEIAQKMGRDAGYAVSKAALNMITIKLANRLRDEGVTAIMIHPGHLKTDMGGPAAAMETADSAGQIVSMIEGLTLADTATFRRWDNTIHPW
jgi:NAD(P)-dependent dehydrogenase (short-subunit alcohol dehydrogenase family)